MDKILVDLKNQTVTVVLNRDADNELEAMREASKILQREVMRNESNNDYRFRR